MLKEILNAKYESHQSSGKFSISGIGGCWRKKYMELKGLYKEDFDEESKRIFNIGNLFHRDIINELISKGGNDNVHLVAAEISVPEHKYLSGRIDGVISDGKDLFIVDIKSAGSWTLNHLRDGICPENYQNQVLLYMYLTGIHHGILLFVGKDKGELEEFEVTWDEEKAKALVKEIEDFFINYVEKNIEPEKCNNSPFWCKCCYPTNDNDLQ